MATGIAIVTVRTASNRSEPMRLDHYFERDGKRFADVWRWAQYGGRRFKEHRIVLAAAVQEN